MRMMLCLLAMRNKGRKIGSRRDWEVHEMDIKGIARILKGTEEGNENKLWKLWKTKRNCEMKGTDVEWEAD